MNHQRREHTTMLFSPSPTRKRLQLQISERRLMLMAGDVLGVLIAAA